jgi:AAA+ ATPase superfamily predicted ATPase
MEYFRHQFDKMSIWCQNIAAYFGHQIVMESFIGRAQERQEFAQLLRRKRAALVTCQGRRRIGKSRFIEECAMEATHFLSFSGLAPRAELGKEDQLEAFATSLAAQTKAPKLKLDNWPTAFQLLASQLPRDGSVVVLFDEISWMGLGDADFAGHLKVAWDQYFSKHPGLILVLCGSVSSWIEKNILNNTGFVGRCSWQFRLEPLPLADCSLFWKSKRISVEEKLSLLAITGGVPGYLREVDGARTAVQNIEAMCFHPGGMLFHEFDRIFHDIFSRRAESYREIVRTLIPGPRTLQQISATLGRVRGGTLGDALTDLEQAGFLRRDSAFDLLTGTVQPRETRFRIADNYLRFYLKYVEPVRVRIQKGLYQLSSLEALESWDVMVGLQFENLVLNSLGALLAATGLGRTAILNAGPYLQTKTLRREGCQVDLLIRTRRSLYLFEMKFRKRIEANVVTEVQEKVNRLAVPRGTSIRTGLIYAGELAPAVQEPDAFDFLIPASQLMQG